MGGIGGNRRVIVIGGEGIALYTPVGSGMQRDVSLSWDVPEFDRQLTEALEKRSASRSVTVLFDGADQAYRKAEDIPKLSPIDRPRFVRRKLELTFPSYPIRASMEIKPPKVKGVRRAAGGTPSYFFVALPETAQVDRVGQALYESGVPVSGFGLLPVESVGLVKVLAEKAFDGKGKRSRWVVLVGQHETGGLRQIVIKDGNLALTRLTPTSEGGASGAGWVDEVAREFKATLTYVSRYGFNQNDGLDVIVICGDVEKQFFEQQDIPATNFKCLNAGEALRYIGVKGFGLERSNFVDILHAAWASRRASLSLPVRVPSIHRVMAPRLAARVGMGLCVLGMLTVLGFSAHSYTQYLSLQEDISFNNNQKIMLDREYEQEAKVFEKLPVKPAVIKASLAVKDLLEKNAINASSNLYALKRALGADIILKELSIEHKAPILTPAANTGWATPVAKSETGTVLIKFSFGLPEGFQLEQKVKRAEDLLAALKKSYPEYDVRIASQFGKVSRTGKFGGGIGDGQQSSGAVADLATFELEGAPLP